MMASVSTFARSSGTANPSSVTKGCILFIYSL
jgi:hypothetical protein